MYIDDNTSREDLLESIYSNSDLLFHFADNIGDPEKMTDNEIRAAIVDWIYSGDECSAA